MNQNVTSRELSYQTGTQATYTVREDFLLEADTFQLDNDLKMPVLNFPQASLPPKVEPASQAQASQHTNKQLSYLLGLGESPPQMHVLAKYVSHQAALAIIRIDVILRATGAAAYLQ